VGQQFVSRLTGVFILNRRALSVPLLHEPEIIHHDHCEDPYSRDPKRTLLAFHMLVVRDDLRIKLILSAVRWCHLKCNGFSSLATVGPTYVGRIHRERRPRDRYRNR
jgi:hypothetical protein